MEAWAEEHRRVSRPQTQEGRHRRILPGSLGRKEPHGPSGLQTARECTLWCEAPAGGSCYAALGN